MDVSKSVEKVENQSKNREKVRKMRKICSVKIWEQDVGRSRLPFRNGK